LGCRRSHRERVAGEAAAKPEEGASGAVRSVDPPGRFVPFSSGIQLV
jgi:hypothetical protein